MRLPLRISHRKRGVALALVLAAGCASHGGVPESSPTSGDVDVRLVTDEADAALAILDRRAHGEPTPADWDRLFTSQGYRHLKEREAGMGRAFTDSQFVAFMMSDTLLRRAPALAAALPALERVDVTAAAGRALAYLPARTRLRSRLYLEIKPRTNSFVFTGSDSVPSIFLFVRPEESPAQLLNTLAHELHHIGFTAACGSPAFPNVTPAERMLLRYLGAFGEGQAMLAAAGSANTHPHEADEDSVRARWDRDVANAPADIAELSRFFASVLDGQVTSADSVQKLATRYYGTQGPWYTVGWLMVSTVEKEAGRDAVIRTLCEPTELIALYDSVAGRVNARGGTLPRWDGVLVTRLRELRARRV